MENKNNKGLIILIVVLVIMVLGLSAYIAYDKLLTNKPKETMSEGEALSIGNELWEYAYSTYWGRKPAWEVTNSNENECDANNVAKIKEKYATDFKANAHFPDLNYTLDTFMHCYGGRGATQTYKETNLIVKEIQDNKITFTAKSEYCDSPFCMDSEDTVEIIEKDFIIIKQNDNWLISYFYLPD